ncbi:SusC/RagA family TonB-linked outer membrane protein [Bacteroidia bacterium]|nr:SusC/RagA family TonB-linked outer membrane protein [Bacteroidia bacterium]
MRGGQTSLRAEVPQEAKIAVTGVVSDADGPIVGAGVVEKGNPSNGVATDIDGKYSLRVSPKATIAVAYLGYLTQEVPVNGRTTINVALAEDAANLDEVVVVGYGTSSKIKVTGAVSTVSTEDFKSRPLTSVSMALQGKVPGVQVTQNSGQPGSNGGTITIRGIGTLNNASPLLIVDGFEVLSLDLVDVKDIESMTVLKDAASASIYGNKAANGVVLITTKKGAAGPMTVEYNTHYSAQSVTRYPERLDAVAYLELRREAQLNSGLQPGESNIDRYREGNDPLRYPNRDWADFYLKPALHYDHHVSIRGGSDKIIYSLSGGFLDQGGIIEGTDYNRFNLRSNVTANLLNDKLRISANLSGFQSTQQDLVGGVGGIMVEVFALFPGLVPKAEGYGWFDSFYDEALREAGGGQTTNVSNVRPNLNINLQIIPQLRLEGAVDYNQTVNFSTSYAPNVTLYNMFTAPSGEQTIGPVTSHESHFRENVNRSYSLSSYATLNYTLNILEDHHLKWLAGAQLYEWNSKYFSTERTRLSVNLPTLSVGDPATQKNSESESGVTSTSFFGRFNYDYADKYLLEANVRHDGSSKFAKGHKWGTFPSFSVGWRIGQESFVKDNLSWVNELKLRYSYGQLGNEKINTSYAGTSILAIGGGYDYIWNNAGVTGAGVDYIANEDLSWETTTQSNIGVDFTVLNMFTFTGDFYVKETSGILMQLPISSTFGFTSDPWKNAGRMKNTGTELSLSYIQKLSNDLEVSAGTSFSFNKNEILDLKGRSPILTGNDIMLKEGLPINTLYGYETEGIYQSDEEIHNHLLTFDTDGNVANSYSGLVAKPGDIRFKDQNEDGIIDMENDRVALGDPNPDFIYSLTGGTKYKGFDMSLLIQGIYGGEGWSSGQLVSPFYGGTGNMVAWMKNRWTPENPNNTYQRVFIDTQRSTTKSRYYVEDLSYLRLKNIELGYTLPKRLLNALHLKGCRVFVSGQNLFTLTPFRGFDPERAGVNSTNIYDYPLVKTFTGGLNLSF